MPIIFAQQGLPDPVTFPGIDGFIPGSRGSIMLDIVFLAMFLVVPVMAVSLYLVKYKKMFALHKVIQIVLGVVLLISITLFEVDMRFGSGWKVRAEASPFFEPDVWCVVWYALCIHLFFAIPTALLWIYVIVSAIRKFPNPPTPSEYSPKHIFWARLAAIEMFMTALTGWIFYTLAFIFES